MLFFSALLHRLNLSGVAVQQYRGKANLRGFLRTLVDAPDFPSLRSLGITRDGDDDPAAAIQSVDDAIAAAGLTAGTARRPVPVAVHTFIFPAEKTAGMLEDLCWQAVEGDEASKCVASYIQCLHQHGTNPRPLVKARMHAWLASRERPDLRLGEAAAQGHIPFDHPAFAALTQFVRSL